MHRIVAAAIALAALTAAPAYAQTTPCLPSAEPIVARLATEYGEALTAGGIDAAGNLVQIYSSDETGSWTVLIIRPGGMACVVSTGEGWVRERDVKAPVTGQPS